MLLLPAAAMVFGSTSDHEHMEGCMAGVPAEKTALQQHCWQLLLLLPLLPAQIHKGPAQWMFFTLY